MRYKLYWGLGILIVLLIGAFTFVMVNQFEKNKQLEVELKEAQELAGQIEERKAAENNPPVAREGFKMVPHGDHWHEVPIDAPDTWQGEPHEPKSLDSFSQIPEFKSDLPDELPAAFPSDEELQQMSYADLKHLHDLYLKEVMVLRKTDYAASVRLYNAILPKIWEKQHEKFNEIRALSKSIQEGFATIPVDIPADVIIEVGEHTREGGN